MSELQIKKIHKSKTYEALSVRETCSIVGGNRNIAIEDSFNDIIIGSFSDDIIITDPTQVTVGGRKIISWKDFI